MNAMAPEELNAECQAAVDDARRLIRSAGSEVPRQLFEELMRSKYPEVRTVASEAVFERPGTIEGFSDRARATHALCLEFLIESMVENRRSFHRYSRFEAAECLCTMIRGLSQFEARSELEDVRNSLAHLCKAGGEGPTNAVVVGILEHLFTEPQFVQLFAPWQSDAELSPVYQEAVKLGASWKEFHQSADYAAIKTEFDRIDQLPPEQRERAIMEEARRMIESSGQRDEE
jgi:hypothetical protein